MQLGYWRWRALVSIIFLVTAACSPDLVTNNYQDEKVNITNLRQAVSLLAGQSFTTTLKAEHSGKCLDMSASTADGVKLSQRTCSGAKNQNFIFTDKGNGYFEIRSEFSGKCLTHLNSDPADGAALVQSSCVSANNQQFRLEDKGSGRQKIHSKINDKCLDVSGISVADGAEVFLYTCWSSYSEMFAMTMSNVTSTPAPTEPAPTPSPTPAPAPTGAFTTTVKNENSGKCLDLSTSTADGVKLTQRICSGVKNQNLVFLDKANGYYEIKSELSGKCLTHQNSSSADGAALIQSSCVGANNQQFRLADKGGGKYKIHSKINDKCVDVSGISIADGAEVFLWTCWYGTNENFFMSTSGAQQPAPEPTPQPQPSAPAFTTTLRAEHSGKCFDMGSSTEDGTKPYQYTCVGAKNQNMVFYDKGGGFYEIRSEYSNKCLTHLNSNPADGAALVQSTCNGATNQLFRLEDKGSGRQKIHSKVNDKCVDVSGISKLDLAEIFLWTCWSGTNENFYMGTASQPQPQPEPIPNANVTGYPNMPSGLTPFVDCPFNDGICGMWDTYKSAKITNFPTTNQRSPAGALDNSLEVGASEGGGQIGKDFNFAKQVYLATWWSTNSDFMGMCNGNNKMMFVRNPAIDNNFLVWQRNPGQGGYLKWYNQATYDNCGHPGEYGMCYSKGDGTGWFEPNGVSSGFVNPGSGWHLIEIYLKSSSSKTSRDGVVRWALDGKIVGNYPTVNLTPGGFTEFQYNHTWDGTNCLLPPNRDLSKAWHHYWDHLFIGIGN